MRSSSCANRSEAIELPGPRSAGRTTPRTETTWRSELIIVSLWPSTTRKPFGSTRVTRAESVVERAVGRVVAPWPCRFVAVVRLARLASTPLAALGPKREAMLLFAADWRDVLVSPVLDASAFSVTWMVTKSSTRLARRSRARSESNADVLHSDPGDPPFCGDGAARDMASPTYWSTAEVSSGLGLGLLLAESAGKADSRGKTKTNRYSFFISVYSTATSPLRSTRARNVLPLSMLRIGIKSPTRPAASARASNRIEAAP